MPQNRCLLVAPLLLLGPSAGLASEDRVDVARALRRATEFFRTQVAVEGGYLWRYSDDLKLREGENQATDMTAWVQPPGTPSVGMAYLAAFEAGGDPYYREAARETAYALVKGQLRSGGWDYRIEFDRAGRKRYAYRVDGGGESARNSTTLDDNNTQSALRLLMRVDRALDFKDAKIHGAADFALGCLLKAQYPNGAWPQRYDRFPEPEKFPVKKASYPETWSRTWPGSDYRAYYTLNDNTLADLIDTMLEASQIYRKPTYRAAALKAGDFFLLAQMPEPQPGWAQQYDANMVPAWARRFEPPAITGGEAQSAMRTLLRLYASTADRKYLEPLPRALAYYGKSVLPDGRLARFYELRTNRPLYFSKQYELTYSDDDLPTHYGFKVSSGLAGIAREYERLKNLDPAELQKPARAARPQLSASLKAQTKAVLSALDEQGRWIEVGRLRSQGSDDPTRRIIQTQTFIKNVGILSQYLAATKP
jgi:hypothetical protein